jgi:hypothetical protein
MMRRAAWALSGLCMCTALSSVAWAQAEGPHDAGAIGGTNPNGGVSGYEPGGIGPGGTAWSGSMPASRVPMGRGGGPPDHGLGVSDGSADHGAPPLDGGANAPHRGGAN